MSLTDFGPVSTTYYNPNYSHGSGQGKGISTVQISGSMPVAAAQTLLELVNNPDGRTTKGGHTGHLETITCPYPVISPFNGLYLLVRFDFVPYKFSNGTIAADFTLDAVYLGDQT